MATSDRTKLFAESKIKASILLKDFRSASLERNQKAASRFQKISRFSNLTIEEIITVKDTVRRKHALAVIAAERGFSSWAAFKGHCTLERPKTPTAFDYDRLFSGLRATFLNRWFVDYGQARDSLAGQGGYLFPYRDQYFICEAGFVEALGLSPKDPNWEKIGWNFVEPLDVDAWERLAAQIQTK